MNIISGSKNITSISGSASILLSIKAIVLDPLRYLLAILNTLRVPEKERLRHFPISKSAFPPYLVKSSDRIIVPQTRDMSTTLCPDKDEIAKSVPPAYIWR